MAATLKYWNGSAWVPKSLKYWTGSAWVAKPLKFWNGSAWVGPVTGGPPYLDNFNRAAANLEASPIASGGWSWTHDGLIAGALICSTGITLRSNTTDGTGSAYKTPSVGSSNHYVQYAVTTTTAGTGPFACCRFADRNNFVGIRTGTGGTGAGQIEVYRRVSGTLTSLYASPINTVIVGDIVRLECSGTNFTVKKNGAIVTGPTAINSAGLTDVGTGVVGRSSTSMTFDDFEAGAL